MRNFQDTFETCKYSFINVSSICMTLKLETFEIQFGVVVCNWSKYFGSFDLKRKSS